MFKRNIYIRMICVIAAVVLCAINIGYSSHEKVVFTQTLASKYEKDDSSAIKDRVAKKEEPKTTQSKVRLTVVIKRDNTDDGVHIEDRAGGQYSIDISKYPARTKVDAMTDYIVTNNLDVTKGLYIGNQTNSINERDGAVTQIQGITVLAVDENQAEVIPEASRVRDYGIHSTGPDATLEFLKQLLRKSDNELPQFIGFDIDNTILGQRPNLRKEVLFEDRKELAGKILTLMSRGVKIAFFTDADSEKMREQIAIDLRKLVVELNYQGPTTLTFYTSGMVSKFTVDIANEDLDVTYDKIYGSKHRLTKKVIDALKNVIGAVYEDENGQIVAKGLLGEFYTNVFAEKDDSGKWRLSTKIRETYTLYQPLDTAYGNVLSPVVEIRDEDKKEGTAAQVAIGRLPARGQKGVSVEDGELDIREELMIEIAERVIKLIGGTISNESITQIKEAARSTDYDYGGDFSVDDIAAGAVGVSIGKPSELEEICAVHNTIWAKNKLLQFDSETMARFIDKEMVYVLKENGEITSVVVTYRLRTEGNFSDIKEKYSMLWTDFLNGNIPEDEDPDTILFCAIGGGGLTIEGENRGSGFMRLMRQFLQEEHPDITYLEHVRFGSSFSPVANSYDRFRVDLERRLSEVDTLSVEMRNKICDEYSIYLFLVSLGKGKDIRAEECAVYLDFVYENGYQTLQEFFTYVRQKTGDDVLPKSRGFVAKFHAYNCGAIPIRVIQYKKDFAREDVGPYSEGTYTVMWGYVGDSLREDPGFEALVNDKEVLKILLKILMPEKYSDTVVREKTVMQAA
ncbi:hypothetical protein ACFL3D_02940 [Candidatus Omnitrophota bacterium]